MSRLDLTSMGRSKLLHSYNATGVGRMGTEQPCSMITFGIDGDSLVVLRVALASYADDLDYQAACDDYDAKRLGHTDGCPESPGLREHARTARDLLDTVKGHLLAGSPRPA